MPGLKRHLNDTTIEVRALDLPPAAPVKRRTWAYPELTSHSLVVLTPSRLYLTPQTGEPKPETRAAVDTVTNLDSFLGPLTTTIDLHAVCKLKLDLLNNTLHVEYFGSGGHGTGRASVEFATPEAVDKCFTKIWRRLGSGFELKNAQRDRYELARAPLRLLMACLFLTAMLVLMVSVVEDFAAARGIAQAAASKSPLEMLFGWMDWRVVCAIGGIGAAASQVWLYRRLTTPPVSLVVVRSGM
jgi:hypothetical protein